MKLRLCRHDVAVLGSIADFRVLGMRHLAALHQRGVQVLRRRARALGTMGLVQITPRGIGERRGRPEGLVSLTEEGVDLLKARGVLHPDMPGERVTAEGLSCLDHHLLVNEFRMQWVLMGRAMPELTVRFLSPTSPLACSSDGRPVIREGVDPRDGIEEQVGFTPDGAALVTHSRLGKSLLFFLEADMGTETVASRQRSKEDVRQKVHNYQTYFRSEGYRRYEGIWGCRFRGFRLLVVASSPARLAALCRLVRRMPPSDFVWLTDQGNLLSQGTWAPIWARGGRLDAPLQSILGNQMPLPTPTPASLM